MSDNLEQNVFSEQVRLLYRGSVRSISMHYLAIVIIVLIIYGKVDHMQLALWAVLLLMITTVRLLVVFSGVPYTGSFDSPARKLYNYVYGVGIHGLSWGLGLGYFLPQIPVVYQAVIFMLVIVGVSVSVITDSTSRLSFFIYLVTFVSPPVITVFLQGHELQIILCAVVVANCTIIANTYLWNYNRLQKAITSRFENEVLMESLVDANEKLEITNTQLESLKYQLINASLTDELTDIANRRHFDTHLKNEWQRMQRNKNPISCLMVDIDFFKEFNDHYGHQKGDKCLKEIAQTIKQQMRRPADLTARYGGEEFVVLLPETPLEAAGKIADDIRENIEALDIPHHKSRTGHVTISVGVACLVPEQQHESEMLVKLADEALYKAKGAGRNQVVIAKDNEN